MVVLDGGFEEVQGDFGFGEGSRGQGGEEMEGPTKEMGGCG